MDNSRLLRIVQLSRHRWHVETPAGTVLVKDITVESVYRAEEYIKNYISSFMAYNYEVIPLKQETDNEKF